MDSNRIVVVFDLDDTLYKEIDYLKSAYLEIAAAIGHLDAYDFMLNSYLADENAFEKVIENFKLSLSIQQLLDIYRNHKPSIVLNDDTTSTLNELEDNGAELCLLTDGRSITQRNKIESLGLRHWFDADNILISEEFGKSKPSLQCYQFFMDRYPNSHFVAVGDNTSKDFITANNLGWTTICLLDDGSNIHKQDFNLDKEYLPKYRINNINQIIHYYV